MKEAIEIKNLTKFYPQSQRTLAVDHVSFSVRKGEIVGLLGPNGAGKTTIIKCIAGLVKPTSGKILLNGTDITRHPKRAAEQVAALLEGNRNIYWRLTPLENLEFFAGLQGYRTREAKEYIEELIELFNLKEKENTPAQNLSRGMQQKLALACALIRQTEILLLDEPTLGLDVETSYELRHLLKDLVAKGERAVLLSSHDMHVVQDVCERVVILNYGKVIVNDQLDNLVKLFQATAYHFEIQGLISKEQELKLKRGFPLLKLSASGEMTYIDVESNGTPDFFDAIEILKESGVKVVSISHKEPNLEELFLKIIKKETG